MQMQQVQTKKSLVPGSNPEARTIRYEKPWTEKAVILAVVILPPLATVLAVAFLWERYVSWLDLGLFFALYILTGFGVTIGFHRLLTHRSFETHPIIKGLLTIFGTAALQGNPLNWVSTHIEHHAHSDEKGDPHSPLAGFWHAHIVWSFTYKPQLLYLWVVVRDRESPSKGNTKPPQGELALRIITSLTWGVAAT